LSFDEKAEICPNCKGTNTVRWIYGLPSAEFLKEFEKKENQGKYLLGGCCVSKEDPEFFCNDCAHEWGESDND